MLKNYQKKLTKLEYSKNNLEHDIDNIFDDDKNAERKRRDMNNRLNRLYGEIYDIEDQIIDCERRKVAAEQKTLTIENVYKMLLAFEQFFDKMSDIDKRKLMESMVSEIHLYPKETWKEGKNPIKEIKYAFPISEDVLKTMSENVSSDETVVLLSNERNQHSM